MTKVPDRQMFVKTRSGQTDCLLGDWFGRLGFGSSSRGLVHMARGGLGTWMSQSALWIDQVTGPDGHPARPLLEMRTSGQDACRRAALAVSVVDAFEAMPIQQGMDGLAEIQDVCTVVPVSAGVIAPDLTQALDSLKRAWQARLTTVLPPSRSRLTPRDFAANALHGRIAGTGRARKRATLIDAGSLHKFMRREERISHVIAGVTGSGVAAGEGRRLIVFVADRKERMDPTVLAFFLAMRVAGSLYWGRGGVLPTAIEVERTTVRGLCLLNAGQIALDAVIDLFERVTGQ